MLSVYARHTPDCDHRDEAEIPPLPLPQMDRWICGQPTFAPVCEDAQLGKS